MKNKTKKKANVKIFVIIGLLVAEFAILCIPFLIEINGPQEITVEVFSDYEDAGATHFFGWDIKTTGEVDTNTVGTYKIVYRSILQRKTRTVIVVDTVAPQVQLNGRERIYVSQNGAYQEMSVIANDNYDGDISDSIDIEGTVDVSRCDEYTLKYVATDSSGNASSVERTVIVVDDDFDYLDELTGADSLNETTVNGLRAIVNDFAFSMKYLENTDDDSLIKSDEQRYLYQGLTNMVVKMHRAMPIDLTMNDYSVKAQIFSIRNSGGNLVVSANVVDTISYNYYPSIDNINCYLCIYTFNAQNELIDVYREEGCFYGQYDNYCGHENYKEEIDTKLDSYYQDWKTYRDTALKALDDLNNGTISYKSVVNKSATHSFNRANAVAYAQKYALNRNYNYFYITDNNCVNFASQCLHAGGLPMIDDGNWVWKNYSYTPNNGDGDYGFSYSWTATSYFMRFARNSSYNIFQTALSPFLSEEGDVIMFGAPEHVGHATVCSRVIRDADGKVIDVLFAGNTNHTLDCSIMASSSYYCECEKVVGYN